MKEVVTLAALVLAVTGCSTSGGSATRTTGSPSEGTPLPTAALTGGADATPSPIMDDIGLYHPPDGEPDGIFASPSGNIQCVFSSANDFAEVDCAINVRAWATPACRPHEVAAVSVGATKQDRTSVHCEGWPNARSVRVLPYGHAVSDMQVTCVSRPTGVSCSNRFHGFTVSRERLKTF